MYPYMLRTEVADFFFLTIKCTTNHSKLLRAYKYAGLYTSIYNEQSTPLTDLILKLT